MADPQPPIGPVDSLTDEEVAVHADDWRRQHPGESEPWLEPLTITEAATSAELDQDPAGAYTAVGPQESDDKFAAAHAAIDRLAAAGVATAEEAEQMHAGLTSTDPAPVVGEPCSREYEHGGHRYWRPGVADRSFECPGRAASAAPEVPESLDLLALSVYERATGERGSLPAMHAVLVAVAGELGQVPVGGPVLGSQAADNAAWQEIHDALYYAAQADGVAAGPATHSEADELTAVVTPILARLVDAARTEERERMIGRFLRDADLARDSWVLGAAASTFATALIGSAHDLDHPDCEDSTVAHLTEWRASRGTS